MKAYFSNIVEPKIPIVNATLYNPLLDKKVSMDFIIDTGFAGEILIPLDIYMKLNLHLFEGVKKTGKFITGMTIKLRVSRAILDFNGIRIPCNVYTYLGVFRSLLGRKLLEKMEMIYSPKQNKIDLKVDL